MSTSQLFFHYKVYRLFCLVTCYDRPAAINKVQGAG